MKIICRKCKSECDVGVPLNTPKNTNRIECNWCPVCQDSAEEDWEEYYIRNKAPNTKKPKQSTLFLKDETNTTK